MAGERTFVVKILGNSDGAITAFKKLAKEGSDSINHLQSVGSKIGAGFDVIKKAAFIAGAAIGVVGAAAFVAVQKASDLNETIQKSNVIFGDAAKKVQDFADTAARSLGQTRQEAINAAATFGTFGKAAGLVGTGLADFSTKFVTLATDLASFNNTSPEEAVLALGAALRGEAEPIRRFGVLMNDAALKQVALEMGIYDGNGALTAQQKVLASSELLFRQTTDAQGDFERTSGGLANQQRILRASIDDIVTTLGEMLLPVFERFVTYVNNNFIPALQAAVDGFKDEGLSGAVKYFAAAFGDITFSVLNQVESLVVSFYELQSSFVNLIKPLAVAVDIFRALADAVTGGDGIVTIEQQLIDRTNQVRQKFDELRVSVLNARAALNLTGNTISGLIDQTDKYGGKILPKAKTATIDLKTSLTDLEKTTGGASKTVETAKQKFEKYTDALKGSTSAQKSFTSAVKGTKEAQLGLEKSNIDLATAQENFNNAINGYGKDSAQAKAAQRELDKAQRNVAQAGFRIEESLFAVTDAEKKLAELRKDPASSPQEIREAEINLAQAKLTVADATDTQFDATNGLSSAQLALNEATTGAIVGSATYKIFLDAVNDAKEAQLKASERVADAADRETEAFEALAEAIKKVAEAAATMPNRNLLVPTLPGVPTPSGATGGGSTTGGGGASIVINTGVGTNGVEAGRQIVQLLQQYTAVDAFAIDRLGFAPRR